MTLLKIFDEAANLISESEDLKFIQDSLAPSGVFSFEISSGSP
jgi:hypothetical protein